MVLGDRKRCVMTRWVHAEARKTARTVCAGLLIRVISARLHSVKDTLGCVAKTTADHTGDIHVSFVRPLLPCGLTDSFVASQVVVVCTRPAVYRRAASTAADLMQHNGRRIQLPELRIVVLKCREYSEASLRAK